MWNDKVLKRVSERPIIIETIEKKWLGHRLPRHCILNYSIEGTVKEKED